MRRENRLSAKEGNLSKKDLTDFVKGFLRVGTEYPVLVTFFLASEIIQGVLIVGEGLEGKPIAPFEIEARMRIATVIGMLGGASAEGLARMAMYIINRNR